MSLFDKRRAVSGRNARPANDGIADELSHHAVTHRLTLDLSRAMNLAAMLASSRAAKFIEIADLLAGLYIYEWERLAPFWPEENREDAEAMLREICQISPQRWNYWIQAYDGRRKQAEPGARWQRLRKGKSGKIDDSPPVPSVSLRAIFEAAEVVSPHRDVPRDSRPDASGDQSLPVLTSECALLCIAKYVASETGRKLVKSGLDVLQLELATIDRKRSPLR